jgi:hypothetical protein
VRVVVAGERRYNFTLHDWQRPRAAAWEDFLEYVDAGGEPNSGGCEGVSVSGPAARRRPKLLRGRRMALPPQVGGRGCWGIGVLYYRRTAARAAAAVPGAPCRGTLEIWRLVRPSMLAPSHRVTPASVPQPLLGGAGPRIRPQPRPGAMGALRGLSAQRHAASRGMAQCGRAGSAAWCVLNGGGTAAQLHAPQPSKPQLGVGKSYSGVAQHSSERRRCTDGWNGCNRRALRLGTRCRCAPLRAAAQPKPEARHCGQYHFPLGCCVMPTHS